jgi:hypothetical protein
MRLRHRFFVSALFVPLLAALSVCLPLWSSSARAQSNKILIVSGNGVPEKLEEDVGEALGDVGSVMSSQGYVGNLRARKQAPDSEEALTKLAPQMGATLIVVLDMSRNKLDVAFRNGHTGRVIDEESVPARGKRPKLAKPAQRKLAAAARSAMSKVGPAPSSAASAPAERNYAETTPSKPASRPATTATRPTPARPTPTPKAQPEPEEEEEEEEESSEGGDEEGEEEVASDAKPKSGGADEGIAFYLNVGGGVGMRGIQVPTSPTRLGGNAIDTTFAPALDVSVMLEFALGDSWRLRLGGAYRTLFALNAAYFTPGGAPASSSLSSHSVVVGSSIGFLTNGEDSMSWHLFLGWAYRGMSAAEPTLPSASIQGPAIRPEVHIPFGIARLRIAPEFILVVGAQAKLPQNVPGLDSVGFAYGGEVSLDFQLSQTIGLGVQFRESRALVSSYWGTSAVENERYISARLTMKF